MPIPADKNIENLEIYNSSNRYKDLFFALSHGVNYGKLKKRNIDDRELFLDTFRNQGIDIDKIYVERAGNLGKGPAAENKKVIFKKYLEQNIYKRMRLFDDAKENLKAFLSFQDEYPVISFEAFLAKPNGSVSRYR